MILRKTILRALRTRAGHTKKECADLLGVVESHIQKAEATRAGLSDRKLARLFEVYGVTPEEAEKVAEEYKTKQRELKLKDAQRKAKLKTQSGVLYDVQIGISERGFPITLAQMVKWLQDGKPIKPEHGEALVEYIEDKIEEYEAAHPACESGESLI